MLQKSIGEIQNQVYRKQQMWDSSWQFHKNRKFNWSGNWCANYLFIILTDEIGKRLLFVLCKCNINEQWTDKKKLGHVKQTDICHYMVYSNIIINLSISSCYMVNHTCDFNSKRAVCARSILKSRIWVWTKLHSVQFYHYICASVFYYQFLILYTDHCPNMS